MHRITQMWNGGGCPGGRGAVHFGVGDQCARRLDIRITGGDITMRS